MTMLFVLWPPERSTDELWSTLSDEARRSVLLRVYPVATERAHLLSLVRDGRDRGATRWRRGFMRCVLAGLVIGCATATTLALFFDMFAGLVGVAFGFGSAVGAFLGAFTAAMTGTERPRDELLLLIKQATYPCRLLQYGPLPAGDTRLLAIQARCDEIDAPRCSCD